MKHALQQLESRVLLAAMDLPAAEDQGILEGKEILMFSYEQSICMPGEQLFEPLQCSLHMVHDTYYTSGEVKSCVADDCHSYFGTVQAEGLESDEVLRHEHGLGLCTLRQHISISAGGTALQCVADVDDEGEGCIVIQGRINWPIAMAS